MEISSLVLRILILLLPGVVAALLFEKLTIHRPWSNFRFGIYTFLFGATAYLVLSTLAVGLSTLSSLGGCQLGFSVTFWDALLDDTKSVSFTEVGFSMLAAVPIALISSAAASRNVVNRLGFLLRATRKYGDEPLFYAELASLDSPILRIWAEHGLVYEGRIRSLSKESGFNELAIEDVIVFDRGLNELYRLRMAFFSCDESKLVVEVVPQVPTKEEDTYGLDSEGRPRD